MKTQEKEKEFLNLLKVIKIFSNNYIEVFPIFGTLLGLIREKKLIQWDKDIDLGYFGRLEDFKKVEKILNDNGFRLFPKFPKAKGIKILSNRLRCKIDIYILNIEKDLIKLPLRGRPQNKLDNLLDFFIWILNCYPPEYKYETIFSIKYLTKIVNIAQIIPIRFRNFLIQIVEMLILKLGCPYFNLKIPKEYLLPLKENIYQNIKIKMINNPEKYLKFIYGKNWKIPMKTNNGKWYTSYYNGNEWVKFDIGKEKISVFPIERVNAREPQMIEAIRNWNK